MVVNLPDPILGLDPRMDRVHKGLTFKEHPRAWTIDPGVGKRAKHGSSNRVRCRIVKQDVKKVLHFVSTSAI